MKFAQCNLSNTEVGASVVAYNKDGTIKIFGGCNIEFAAGAENAHAEQVALYKAISEGYLHVTHVFVTSSSFTHRAALCGRCLHWFSYVNPECMIVVLNPDGTEKLSVTVRERNGVFGYNGNSKLDKTEFHGSKLNKFVPANA
jgi:cytidine deaminase